MNPSRRHITASFFPRIVMTVLAACSAVLMCGGASASAAPMELGNPAHFTYAPTFMLQSANHKLGAAIALDANTNTYVMSRYSKGRWGKFFVLHPVSAGSIDEAAIADSGLVLLAGRRTTAGTDIVTTRTVFGTSTAAPIDRSAAFQSIGDVDLSLQPGGSKFVLSWITHPAVGNRRVQATIASATSVVPTTVQSLGADSAFEPYHARAGMTSTGRSVVAWQQQPGGGSPYDIHAQVASTTTFAAQRILSSGGRDAQEPEVTVGGKHALVTWTSSIFTTSNQRLAISALTSTGSFTAQQLVQSAETQINSTPVVSMNASGKALLGWIERPGSISTAWGAAWNGSRVTALTRLSLSTATTDADGVSGGIDDTGAGALGFNYRDAGGTHSAYGVVRRFTGTAFKPQHRVGAKSLASNLDSVSVEPGGRIVALATSGRIPFASRRVTYDRFEPAYGWLPAVRISPVDDALSGGSGDGASFGAVFHTGMLAAGWTRYPTSVPNLHVLGADSIVLGGGTGNDSVAGTAAADTLFLGAGNDVAMGKAGRDIIEGQAGNDRIDGGPGRDILRGGAGNDDIVSADGRRGDRVNCGSGRRDIAFADRGDKVDRSCETIRWRRA